MKHATPFSCFIFGLPKPFPQHSWEPFLSLPKPIPPHAWEPWSTQTSLSACFCTMAFHQAYLTKMTKHVLFQLVFAKRHFSGHTWQSTFSFSFSCKTAFHQAYLTKHVLFQLILQNGISPGILHTVCSLSACLCKNNFTRPTWHWIHYMNSGFRSPLLRLMFCLGCWIVPVFYCGFRVLY